MEKLITIKGIKKVLKRDMKLKKGYLPFFQAGTIETPIKLVNGKPLTIKGANFFITNDNKNKLWCLIHTQTGADTSIDGISEKHIREKIKTNYNNCLNRFESPFFEERVSKFLKNTFEDIRGFTPYIKKLHKKIKVTKKQNKTFYFKTWNTKDKKGKKTIAIYVINGRTAPKLITYNDYPKSDLTFYGEHALVSKKIAEITGAKLKDNGLELIDKNIKLYKL